MTWPMGKGFITRWSSIKRYVVLTLLLVFIIAPLTGCWSRREIETLSFVMALGIDKSRAKNEFRVTMQIAKPALITGTPRGMEGGGGQERPVWVTSGTGRTLADAVRTVYETSPRVPFLSHTRAIIIGEELAREGIGEVVDFLHRDRQFRRTPWFLIARGEATRVLAARLEQERLPAQGLHLILQSLDVASTGVMTRLGDFLTDLHSEATQPVATRIEVVKEVELPGFELSEVEGTRPKEIRISGGAVFRGDRLIGWLDPQEARGFLWVRGKVSRGIQVVSGIPEIDPDDPRSPKLEKIHLQDIPARKPAQAHPLRVALDIIRSGTRIEPEFRGDRVIITVKIKEEGNIAEVMTPVDVTTEAVVKALDREQAKLIREEIQAALDKAQKELKVDIFGFGEEIFRKYPRRWEELKKTWAQVFPNVEVRLMVDAKLRRSGLIATPAVFNRKIGINEPAGGK